MFKSPFQSPFQNPFSAEGAAVVDSWWLSGGISPSSVEAAYQPVSADSLAASYVNLSNPGTNDAYLGDAPSWDSNGWAFDGVSNYLKTGVVPSSGWTIAIQYANILNVSGIMMGGYDVSTRGLFIQDQSANRFFAANQSFLSVLESGYRSSGNIIISGQSVYFDGADKGVTISTAATTWYELFIGCSNNRDVSAIFFSNYVCKAVEIINTTITSGQVTSLSSAMSAL